MELSSAVGDVCTYCDRGTESVREEKHIYDLAANQPHVARYKWCGEEPVNRGGSEGG